MPQFIPNTEGEAKLAPPFGQAQISFHDLDAFTQAYIEAMFWTNTATGWSTDDIDADREGWEHDEREGLTDGPIPNDVGFAELSPESLTDVISQCRAFQREASHLLAAAYQREGYDESRAGHDFWLTRVGHGVGYWDRRELARDGLGDRLSTACGTTEINLFWDHDNRVIHVE